MEKSPVGPEMGKDIFYMREAILEAKAALEEGEIPVGAVIVREGEIIGRGHNTTEQDGDPTAHAEINAIRQAGRYLRETLSWRRLTGCEIYVTMEPCSMCAGALVWARLESVCAGVPDPKAGGCGSVLNIIAEERLNHQVQYRELEECPEKDTCRDMLQDFFRELRSKPKWQNRHIKSEEDIK